MKIINEEYLDYIRSKPCLICGIKSDPHHLIARTWRESKRNDYTAINLCRKHHSEVEQIALSKFESKYHINLWKEVALLIINYVQFYKKNN